jgi:hypothetical protein
MASGIDMSARLITLAINIALMGFVLLQGILSYLKAAVPVAGDALPLGALAAKIAAGAVTSLGQAAPELAALDPSGAVVHAALMHGFGLVMLYGGIGVWVLAVLSFLTFGPAKAAVETGPLASCAATEK